ncbi:hypothetical protein MSG28_001074 [Choristoneura fumiferana]|uniref:Uncharacterized protein n=1 Tax=Choristoneura fumiferana TaxID=7141 RepID=A0ACC0K3M6_CHOFU|nr:hypothetical protein MSG28_001074 [Choristoneura fumiferana]
MSAAFYILLIKKMASKPTIRDFYKGRSVLVTGGTGFMGKVLIEKLLYTIPDIGNIYVVMRSKKGDVLFEDLGISSKDMDMLVDEVSVVFHFAATLRLEAPLKECIVMNTTGTQRALNVAKRLKNLAIFVHLSTAFCYPDYKVLEEKFHCPPADPQDVIRLCDWLDDKQLVLLTKSLLSQHPNSYTYSKRLAENLVNDAYAHMPTAIARPSIVCPSYVDPVPGWVDNLNGPVGLMLAAGKGVIRTMLCDGSLHAQVIPVDIAINAIIALAMIEGSKTTKVQQLGAMCWRSQKYMHASTRSPGPCGILMETSPPTTWLTKSNVCCTIWCLRISSIFCC